MDIARIFREGYDLCRRNTALFVPPIAALVIAMVLTLLVVGGGMHSMEGAGGGMSSPETMATSFSGPMGGALLIGILGSIIGIFAHGVTVAMALEAVVSGRTSVKTGLDAAKARMAPLLLASVFAGLLVMTGLMLLVIPGIAAAFFLMFTFVIIMTGNAGAVDAMKESFRLVKARPGDSLILFAALFASGIIFGLANMVLNMIPVLGQLAGIVLMGVFSGYVSVVMVLAYRKMTEQAGAAVSL